MSSSDEKMVPLKEAENEVKVVVQRLALLHLAYARTLVDNFGWKKGKQLVLDAIKEYGKRVAERTKQGHQSLPKYGFYKSEGRNPPICEFGKIVLEYDELDIGSLYCLIDPAKTMVVDRKKKLIHKKCMTVGDQYCDFSTEETSKEDKERFFSKGKDWSSVDPTIHNFYMKKERRKK